MSRIARALQKLYALRPLAMVIVLIIGTVYGIILVMDRGNPTSQVARGRMYAEGRDVPRNDPEAVRLFRLAADRGLPEAHYNLGLM